MKGFPKRSRKKATTARLPRRSPSTTRRLRLRPRRFRARRTSPAAAAGTAKASQVSFTANGSGTLPDGSEGVPLRSGSLTGTQNVEGSGSHEVCGTVENVLGEQSAPACVTVPVDASAPNLEIECPAAVVLGEPARSGRPCVGRIFRTVGRSDRKRAGRHLERRHQDSHRNRGQQRRAKLRVRVRRR